MVDRDSPDATPGRPGLALTRTRDGRLVGYGDQAARARLHAHLTSRRASNWTSIRAGNRTLAAASIAASITTVTTASTTERSHQMATKLFVNVPVKDLDRSKDFFATLGFEFYGAADDMASVIISEHTQVMLLEEATFANYAPRDVADPTKSTEAILVLGVENREQVDELVDKALTAGGTPAGTPMDSGSMYQRGFFDLDGHQWAALCLVQPAG
jgi:predicted lactoylglutathione lyase